MPSKHSTGCPNKHGNSVTNSMSSFRIILWFSLVIPTEKAVICKSFVCYVHILFVYMFWLHTVVLSKTRKLQYTNRVNLSVLTVHLAETYKHIFTVFYPFHKINSSRHNIRAFEIRYYNAISWQRRYPIRHWIPMFFGTPCLYLV